MRLSILLFFVTFAFVVQAQKIQSSVQHITYLGPDVGFLVENLTSEKMHFSLNVIPQDCSKLGLDSMKLRGSMSSIDNYGEIQANDFMVVYYSLGAYNYKTPCLLNVYLETIVGKEIKETSFLLDTSDALDDKEKVNENQRIEVPVHVRNSFKRMNDTHYELTLLLQNHNSSPKLVELKRLQISCEYGDVFIKQTDNFLDGIKNGRSVIKGMSWRAYKVIYESTKEPFKCSSTATFKGVPPYTFKIENSLKKDRNNTSDEFYFH